MPSNKKMIGYKWVFRVKYNSNSSIKRYKVKFVAQEFSQVHGIHYTETFTPTIRYKSLKIFLLIVAMLRIMFLQMDIIEVYIKSKFSQNKLLISMKIP